MVRQACDEYARLCTFLQSTASKMAPPGTNQGIMNPFFEVITVSGSDARAFLQGQLTQDVAALGETPSALAAWCNPKGRVISVMRLIGRNDDEIGLVVPSNLVELLVRRLSLFLLRARAEVKPAGAGWQSVAVAGREELDTLEAFGLLPPRGRARTARQGNLVAADLGTEPRCVEVHGPVPAFEEVGLKLRRTLTAEEWQLALVDAGIPLILPATSEKYTPHMLNLDRLGAISFNKGCYTGQEVVARTQHLGQSRRRLMHFRTSGGTLAVGDKLRHEDREVGEVVNAVGDHLLAVVPVELHDQRLLSDAGPAVPVPLPYA